MMIAKKNFWEPKALDGYIIAYFLMPNGQIIVMECNEMLSLSEIKLAVFNEAKDYPIYSLLKEPKYYNFSYVTNHGTIQVINESEESLRKLVNLRNLHKPVFKFVEAEFNDIEKYIQSQISSLIGYELTSVASTEFTMEENHFLSKYKEFVQKLAMTRDEISWEKRLPLAYPPDIDFEPNVPTYLKSQLIDGKEFKVKLVLDTTLSTAIIANITDTPTTILPKVINAFRKKYIISEDLNNVFLKVVGQNSYLCKDYDYRTDTLTEYPIIRYKYIRECLRSYKTPRLTICKKSDIKLQYCELLKKNDPPQKPHKATKIDVIHLWEMGTEEFTIRINYMLNIDSNEKFYGIECGIFVGKERISKTMSTELKQGPNPVFNQIIGFDICTKVLPQMAKLCLCLYTATKSTNKSMKHTESIGWVNIPIFDFQGNLNLSHSSNFKSSDGMFNDFIIGVRPFIEITNNIVLNPLGTSFLPHINNNNNNNNIDDSNILISISFKKSLKNIKCPTKDDYVTLYNKLKKNDINSLQILIGNTVSKFFLDNKATMDESKRERIKIIERIPPSEPLCSNDCTFLWNNWKLISEKYPHLLKHLLKSIDWTIKEHIAVVYALLEKWPILESFYALELLDYTFPDEYVRAYAVSCLDRMCNIELECYLLQLIQALKFEIFLDCSLVKFLITRAVYNRRITHFIFWILKSEMGIPEFSTRFSLILDIICRGDFGYCQLLNRQVEFLERLEFLSSNIQKAGNLDRQTRKSLFIEFVTMPTNVDVFQDILNPLDPRFHMNSLKIECCDIKESKKKPIFLVFTNMDSLGKDIKILFKFGDDLRQDILTLQTIRVMDHIWQNSGYDLKLIPYKVLASGINTGLIEIVDKSCTLGKIHLNKGFKKNTIYEWIIETKPQKMAIDNALEMFKLSCTAYSIVTLVLGIGDRHNDNVMIKENGNLFHIDFGHFLGNYKSFMGIRRERVPFLLTTDFLFAATVGSDEVSSTKFKGFQKLCEDVYMALRKYGNHIVTLFALMINSNLPELNKPDDLKFLINSLSLGKSKKEAVAFFREKFKEAYNGRWSTYLNFYAHNKRVANSSVGSNKLSEKAIADLKNDILEI